MEQYQPLFTKYRPQSLSDLVGQQYAALTLTNAIKHDRISHAYLFTGPRGTGKTSSARILAKSLNCQRGPTVDPCQVCTSCLEITQGISQAVLEIDAASNNSVDDARTLIERAPLVAPGGRFKLYIIDECHMLTKEAFNALLKTIEEPPAKVIFVLATTEEHKVPPTILSRCQRLIFRLINQKEMSDHLERIASKEAIAIEPQAVELIVRRSGGGLRDALGLLDQASLLASPEGPVCEQDLLLLLGALQEDVLLSLGKSILGQDAAATLRLTDQLLNEGREPYLIASELARHFLNMAKASCLASSDHNNFAQISSLLLGSPKYIESLITFTHTVDRHELAQMIETLDRLETTCKRSSQPALHLEIGLISLCHRLNIVDLKSMEARIARLESELEIGGGSQIPNRETAPKANFPEPEKSSKEEPLPPDISSDPTDRNPKVLESPASSSPQKPDQDQTDLPIHLEHTSNIDSLWQAILDELRERHLPTFSLASTHAFPLSLIKDELTIGVLVLHFQKMLETKIEHIQTASCAVSGQSLKVRIKTVDKTDAPLSAKGENKQDVNASSEKEVIKQELPSGIRDSLVTQSNKVPNTKTATIEPGQEQIKNGPSKQSASTSHMIQDAYRLFEGPGSRLIVSSQ